MSPAPTLILLIASLVLSEGTIALSFTANCTLPPDYTNYVSGPNVRSTLSILWNCLSIIILCTWNILHLNVPARRPTASSAVQKLWGLICDSSEKAKWMILSILMPELLLGKAFDEFLWARHSSNNFLAKFAMDDGTEWGLTHSYFANMGGFVLDFTEIFDQQLSETSPEKASALFRLVDKVASEYNESLVIDLLRIRHTLWPLTSIHILEALGCTENCEASFVTTRDCRTCFLDLKHINILALLKSSSGYRDYMENGSLKATNKKGVGISHGCRAFVFIGAYKSERSIDGDYDLVPIPNVAYGRDDLNII